MKIKKNNSNKPKKEKNVIVKKCLKCGRLQIFYKINSVCFCKFGAAVYTLPEDV